MSLTFDDIKTFQEIKNEMKFVYKYDNRPWMIGFSGGKDSTLLVTLVMEMLQSLQKKDIKKKVYIVSSDTGVENPIVREYMHRMSFLIGEKGAKLGIVSKVITPPIEKTFWSCVIGLGYPTPEPPGFRWCTDKLKIQPINNYTLKTIKENGEVVMLLGVRKAESSYRARSIKSREVEGKLLTRHTDIENAYVYNPLTEIPNNTVWEYLLKEDSLSPWQSDNKYLFQLYQGENLGEEESSLGQVDKSKIAVTGNSRFGCWVCTMVVEDKSLKNFIDKGSSELIPLRNFRNWLLSIRNKEEYRENKRRNGAVYLKENGTRGLGPFTMRARQMILEELLKLEVKTGMELITIDELKCIDRLWENEGDLYRRNLVEIYFQIKQKRLPWDEYRLPLYDESTIKTIKKNCKKYDIDFDFFSKLAVSIEQNKHNARGNKIAKSFDRIINEGWLHFDNIKTGKENLENEN